MSASPSIDNLERTWSSLADLCAGLSEEEWKRPTGCPGWSVQDQVSHLIDYEARLLGRPGPDGEARPFPHTKNALGESNEIGVEHRRGLSGRQVLDELREVTAARSAQLGALSADDLAGETVTPVGPAPVADMLRLRVMDTWSHEQDIRRAVGRPGHEAGPAVDESVAYFAQFLPAVVGKRAGLPDGAVVVFEIGDAYRGAIEMVAGRARPVDAGAGAGAGAGAPTVRLTMPAPTFAALVGGRSDAPDDVAVDGDTDLARRIIDVLGFMP
jgi:uncharacterized protein (TIGR03083 family)